MTNDAAARPAYRAASVDAGARRGEAVARADQSSSSRDELASCADQSRLFTEDQAPYQLGSRLLRIDIDRGDLGPAVVPPDDPNTEAEVAVGSAVVVMVSEQVVEHRLPPGPKHRPVLR
jgi:hypothetical protein